MKKGISLIVLIMVIIVMIILAGAIIISLNDINIIDRAKEAVNESNIDEIQHLAALGWTEAYLDGQRNKSELEKSVKEYLLNSGIKQETLNLYSIDVTEKGVTVTDKNNKKVYTKAEIDENENIFAIGKDNAYSVIGIFDESTETLTIRTNGVEKGAIADGALTEPQFDVFYDIDKTINIIIEEGIIEIGSSGLNRVNVENLHIPSSVSTMGSSIVGGCENITFGEEFDITKDTISDDAFMGSYALQSWGELVEESFGYCPEDTGGDFEATKYSYNVHINGKTRKMLVRTYKHR